MAKRVSVDGWLFTVTLFLVFLGLVMVFSASAVMAKERYGSGYYFLLRQLGWAAGGIVAMVVAMKVDYRRYKHPGGGLFGAGHHHADADLGLLSRPRPQHASLDPLQRILLPALGGGQARR